ncbi:MAG: hypothetical protein AB7P97_20885 [Hyphomonadaceae bacterium]
MTESDEVWGEGVTERRPRSAKRANEQYLAALTWAIDATKHPRPPAYLVKTANKFLTVAGELDDALRFAHAAEGATIASLLVRVFGADAVADYLIDELKQLTKGRGRRHDVVFGLPWKRPDDAIDHSA